MNFPIQKTALVLLLVFLGACTNNKTLVSFKDNAGKTVSITISQAIEDLKPLLLEAQPEEINSILSNRPELKNVINGISVVPRIMREEALKMSNFIEDPSYQEQIALSSKKVQINEAYQKSIGEINGILDKEKIPVAEISRIFIKKTEIEKENNAAFAAAEQILADLKNASNLVEAFGKAAAEKSQEPIGQQSNGYIGEMVPGTYPSLDKIILEDKAPAGLYSEIIDAPEAYYIVYIHAPAQQTPMKEISSLQLSQARAPFLFKYLERNLTLQSTWKDNVLKVNGKEVQPETLSEKTPVAKFWGRSLRIGEVIDILLTSAPEGTLRPKPLEVVQILNDSEDFYNKASIALVAKNYKPRTRLTKNEKQVQKDYIKQLDEQFIQGILQTYIMSQIDTNVSVQETRDFYSNLTEKPVKDYKPNGDPIYYTYKELEPELQQQIQVQRGQQFFMSMLGAAGQERDIIWEDKNINAYGDAFAKEYAKVVHENEDDPNHVH